ncbi:MAG: hypothetical protein Q8P35_03205 [Candidatus Yanofskybacteria bacterium]|nr:hypothetical protein [Candidatus Yanofskybacteria bacterium]
MKQLFALVAIMAISLLAPAPIQAQSPIGRLIDNHLDLVDGRFYGSYRFHHERYGRYSGRYGYGYDYRGRGFGQRLGRTALNIVEYGAIRAIDDRYDRRRMAFEPPVHPAATYATAYPDYREQAPPPTYEPAPEPRVRQKGISVVNTSGSVLYVEYEGQPWELFPDGEMSVGAVVENFKGNPDKLEAFVNILVDGTEQTVPVRYKFAPNGGLRFARP